VELLVLIYAMNESSAVTVPVSVFSVSAFAVTHPTATTMTNAAENLFKKLISNFLSP
jgi:hypothetical protein